MKLYKIMLGMKAGVRMENVMQRLEQSAVVATKT